MKIIYKICILLNIAVAASAVLQFVQIFPALFPMLIAANIIIQAIYGMIATTECQNYYKKSYIRLRKEELRIYKTGLKRKDRKIIENTPDCLKHYYKSLKVTSIFFFEIALFMILWLLHCA